MILQNWLVIIEQGHFIMGIHKEAIVKTWVIYIMSQCSNNRTEVFNRWKTK